MPLTPAQPVLDGRLLGFFSRRFNCDFTIVSAVDTDDGQGGKSRAWTNVVLEVLGSLEELSANERLAQGGAGATSTHLINIPYANPANGTPIAVDLTMRITLGTRTFDIQSVTDFGNQHLLLFIYVEEQFRK